MTVPRAAWSDGRPLRLATRGSPLARRQTELVAARIAAVAPGITVETVVVSTKGDRLAGVPLDRVGGQGIFVKEIQWAVLDGSADIAVHSAKDLPPVCPDGLVVAAVPPRADPRDALVGSRLADLPPGGSVATGSARRRAQLANVRPDLTFVDLRGNMAKRVASGEDGSVGAVVVAVAALERLGWVDRITEVLPSSVMLPQVGQGAIALECRAGDDGVRALLADADDPASSRTFAAERALLAGIGGSCALPVGAWAEHGGDLLTVHGLLASGDGRVVVRATRRGNDPGEVGHDLAHALLVDCGGAALLDEAAILPMVAGLG